MENLQLTQEEKIDYIFKTLQKQEKRETRKLIGKTLFRIFIVIYLIYFYMFGFSKILDMINKQIKENFKVEVDSKEILNNFKDKVISNY
ncbi:MAG: hypothetical protein PHV23_00845 [Candidatus Gracilibacteria bacterium]|nr:hypothetical protein [Candidatus Gracilibacteria bacterium]